MYKYTAEPKILRSLELAKKIPYGKNGSATWNLAQSYFTDYTMIVYFLQYWEKTTIYSKSKLQHVPVNGILFPVTFFRQERIE